ncbi:MAG TPA: TIGR01459 family HAD-type hydrolase [Caulobacterales bacterium]|nr:TIGR01459 family HAD-type hydrolase [Caulobacterales bacterium]
MKAPLHLDSIDAIASDYDAVFCDVWGVVHNGRAHYARAVAALSRLRAAGRIVLLVSNVPKPRDPIPRQLDRLGVPRSAWDGVVTSGDAIRAELATRAPGPMLKIGPENDRVLWADLGLEFSDLERARFIGISGLNHDEHETPADYAELLKAARTRDLELLCANPDIVVRVGDRLIWCAGAIAREYQALGGRVIMAGKPFAPIYQLAFRELESLTGARIPKARVLAIGDGIGTDVRGANDQGIDCVFIASGMHGEALSTNGALDPEKVETALASESVSARYVMRELA